MIVHITTGGETSLAYNTDHQYRWRNMALTTSLCADCGLSYLRQQDGMAVSKRIISDQYHFQKRIRDPATIEDDERCITNTPIN